MNNSDYLNDRKLILEKLNELGVEELTIEYSGYGDCGQVDGFDVHPEVNLDSAVIPWRSTTEFFAEGRWQRETSVSDKSLSEIMEEFAYDVLGSNHPGWENSDGADGTLVFKIKEKDVQLTHNSHYTQTETFETKI